ncbi:hypothetical protein MNBD_CHLOROFLEXI01-2416 [hydrothermal vent metagenome]|uniref:Uncharacterized protein n=1 Tax=hydrothermal vent metagenome TaxID=652676 RepID=A0A3B0W5X8_9ZZZZ
MKIKNSVFKTAIFASLLVLLTLTMWQNTSAATNSVTNYGWCCSGVNAIAQLRALAMNPSQGTCDITSKTSPLTTVNIIGWAWWQCDTMDNNGIIINHYMGTPRASPPASSVTASLIANYCNYGFSPPKCGYQVKASGKHDFNQTGANPWTPYHSVTGP